MHELTIKDSAPCEQAIVIPEISDEQLAAAMEELARDFDGFEARAVRLPQVYMPVTHRFTSTEGKPGTGMYSREIFMPAGTWCTSGIHRTEHQFVVLDGLVSVWIDGVGLRKIKGPFVGMTKAGTRRMLYIHADCRWITFHPTDLTDIDEIEKMLLVDHYEHLGLQPDELKELRAFVNRANVTPLAHGAPCFSKTPTTFDLSPGNAIDVEEPKL